jgi:hypothetical protein
VNGPIIVALGTAGDWMDLSTAVPGIVGQGIHYEADLFGGTNVGGMPGLDIFEDALLGSGIGPTGLYLNLRTSDFPGGEIRGQVNLVNVPEPGVSLLSGMGLAGLKFASHRLRRSERRN